jgi:hypothetical protein
MTYEHWNRWKIVSGTLELFLGLWLCASPWMFGVAANAGVWNLWICGAAIAIFALIQLSSSAWIRTVGKLNLILGVWVFASPWAFSYTGETARFVNSLCVGVLVVLLSAATIRPIGPSPAHQ